MAIDLEMAVRTLVRACIDQTPGQAVTIGLVVAVLARKFSAYPVSHIARIVTRTVLEEGGTVDLSIPATAQPVLRRSA